MSIKISLGWVFSMAVPIGGGCYMLGLNTSSERVEHLKATVAEYEKSGQFNAPDLIKSLRQSADAINLSASERTDFDKTKIRVKEYQSHIDQCESKLKDTTNSFIQCSASIDKFKTELKSYTAEGKEWILSRGDSVDLIQNKLVLGLAYVGIDNVDVVIDSKRSKMEIGSKKEIKTDLAECSLWLTNINKDDKVTFKFNCLN